jgi:hypothetical protein
VTQKKKGKKIVGVIILIIIVLMLIGIFLLFLNYKYPGLLQSVFTPIKTPENHTTIIQNQTVNQDIDQRTSVWDFFKWSFSFIALLVFLAGVMFLVIIMLKKKVNPKLGRDDVIRLHKELINHNHGHYRLEKKGTEDSYHGSLLLYHPYYDNDYKTGKSYPRAVTFWSLNKLWTNTPISYIPRQDLLCVDSSTRNKQDAWDNAIGPIPEMNWKDWLRWKHDLRYGLIGAQSSPVAEEQYMTPEQQKQWHEKIRQISEDIAIGGSNE